MRENTHFDAWIEGVHFHLGVCAPTRTWYAYSPDRSIRFAGIGDMADVVPTVRRLLAISEDSGDSANNNAAVMVRFRSLLPA